MDRLDVDVKAAAFEGLLEKAAGRGQERRRASTSRPASLIQSIVRCMKPDPRQHKDFTICDPACGTGGFLVCGLRVADRPDQGRALDRDLAKRVKTRPTSDRTWSPGRGAWP